jgi:hypothetical protein
MKGIYILILILVLFVLIFLKPITLENMDTSREIVGCSVSPDDYKRVGCYIDTPDRAIPNTHPIHIGEIRNRFGTEVALKVAKDLAGQVGAKVFGIQYGGYLFYGDDVDAAMKNGKAPNDSCTNNLGAGIGWVNDVWALNDSDSSSVVSTPLLQPINVK